MERNGGYWDGAGMARWMEVVDDGSIYDTVSIDDSNDDGNETQSPQCPVVQSHNSGSREANGAVGQAAGESDLSAAINDLREHYKKMVKHFFVH